ncbi:TPA: acylneuraminate cytidylyltransferase [Candidatus Micrarchaeota archaeon]|nr:acylneuraminate cytidylyltransferase [Candidatus Micrarchaeota archaeon]
MKIIAIIQSRMGSTRLPGKSLAEINGKPMLQHVVERARKSKLVNEVIVATTDQPEDNAIEELGRKLGVTVFRGSENDVLDRYYQAAKNAGAEVIVRITADCPLIDAAVSDRVVELFLNEKVDYASNTQPPTFPDGLDTEVFTFAALEKAWNEAELTSEREHVTPYIWKNPDKFRLKNYANGEDLSAMRWTVDSPADLQFVKGLFSFGNPDSMEAVLEIIKEHPELQKISEGIERNEGYAKSVKED